MHFFGQLNNSAWSSLCLYNQLNLGIFVGSLGEEWPLHLTPDTAISLQAF